MSELEFTGEYCVPGKTLKRIEDDHISRYEFVAQFVKDKNVLDIASGAGYGTNILREGGAKSVIGVDIEKKLVDFSNNKYNFKNISYLRGDITTFNIDKKFDVIVCFETIEHILDDKKAIQNLYSLLKTGGKLFISSPNRPITSPNAKLLSDKPANKYHVREYLVEELSNLLRSFNFELDGIYGQRLRLMTMNKLFNKFINFIFKPDGNTSAKIRSYKYLTPRYFILLATKK